MKTQNENPMASTSSDCTQSDNSAWQTTVCLLLLLASLHLVQAETYVGGSVSGIWTTNGSPYIVQSNLLVIRGTQLTIDAGVVVRFQAGTGTTIEGALVAEGTPSNKVIFTSDQVVKMPGDWGSIAILGDNTGAYASAPAPSASLRHCIVEYATTGIRGAATAGSWSAVASLTVQDTIVRSCSDYGIDLWSSGSPFYRNTGAKLNAAVDGCRIYSNASSGIRCFGERPYAGGYISGSISGNVVFSNGGHGIETFSDDTALPAICNNVVWGNGGSGVEMELMFEGVRNTFGDVRNNVVVSNAVGITGYHVIGGPGFYYNDVWANSTNWAGEAKFFETAAGNISADPLCYNPSAGDFHLRSQAGRYDPATGAWFRDTVTSPCIDAGDPASAFAIEPEPNGGRINMGAFGGTPYASKSLPRLTGVLDRTTQDLVLSWGCLPGETYQVLYSPMPAGPWLDDLPGSQLTAGVSQTTLTLTNTSVGAQTNRFYLVRWNTP